MDSGPVRPVLLPVLLQALAQVDNYLRSMGVVKEAVDDTAGAAQMVSQQKLQVSDHSSCTGVCCRLQPMQER